MARAKTELSAEDRKLLTRCFRIPPTLLKEAGIERINHAEAQKRGFYLKGAVAPFDGICFPYLTGDGQIVNARLRRDECETNEDGEPANKYLMLPKSAAKERGLYMLPADRKRLMTASSAQRAGLRVGLMEAEKSVLAATAVARRLGRKDLIFVATGGCDSYNTPDLALLRGLKVDVLLDSNVWTSKRPAEVEPLIVTLLETDYQANAGVLRLPRDSRAEGINGPDDFIAEKTDAAFIKLIDGPRAEPWLDYVGVSWDAYNNAKPPRMAINGLLQEDGVTLFGGLPSSLKTWVMLSMVRALLTGAACFGYFPVGTETAKAPPRCAKRVIYLTPEVGLGSFKQRLELMDLGPYVKSQQLVIRTLSQTRIELTNPHLLRAAKDAHVFLDTVVRFIQGAENENKDNDTGLAAGCFALLQAGARSVVGAHHATKNSGKETEMTLENMFRGAGDIGAFVRTAYGLKKIGKDTSRVKIECVKPGDFTAPAPFILEGRPHIDEHEGMLMSRKPGEVPEPARGKQGRQETPDKAARVDWLLRQAASLSKQRMRWTYQSLADQLHKVKEFSNIHHDRETVAKWMRDAERERKEIERIEEQVTKFSAERKATP